MDNKMTNQLKAAREALALAKWDEWETLIDQYPKTVLQALQILTTLSTIDAKALGEAVKYFDENPQKHPNVNGYFNVITQAAATLHGMIREG